MKTRHVVFATLALIGLLFLCANPSEAANVRVGKPLLPVTTTLVTPPIFANTFECTAAGITGQAFSFRMEIISIGPLGETLREVSCPSSGGCWATTPGNGYPAYCRITVGGTNTPEAVRGALKGQDYNLNSDGYYTYFAITSVEAH